MLDGPPPAFIIMTYIVGLAALIWALIVALGRLRMGKVVVLKWPFRITLGGFGLFFLVLVFVANMMALINVIISTDRHALDSIILFMLLPLNAYPVIILFWGGRRIIGDP